MVYAIPQVLLAEDNVIDREIALSLLRPLGITPLIVGNGLEAVALCATRPFDIVLMDIQMPVMDGLEATRRIRAGRGPTPADVPIIAMTANTRAADKNEGYAAGLSAYITKPVSRNELCETICRFSTLPHPAPAPRAAVVSARA